MGHWKRRNELGLTHTNQDIWPTHFDPSGLMAQVEKSLFLLSGSSCPEEGGVNVMWWNIRWLWTPYLGMKVGVDLNFISAMWVKMRAQNTNRIQSHVSSWKTLCDCVTQITGQRNLLPSCLGKSVIMKLFLVLIILLFEVSEGNLSKCTMKFEEILPFTRLGAGPSR